MQTDYGLAAFAAEQVCCVLTVILVQVQGEDCRDFCGGKDGRLVEVCQASCCVLVGGCSMAEGLHGGGGQCGGQC